MLINSNNYLDCLCNALTNYNWLTDVKCYVIAFLLDLTVLSARPSDQNVFIWSICMHKGVITIKMYGIYINMFTHKIIIIFRNINWLFKSNFQRSFGIFNILQISRGDLEGKGLRYILIFEVIFFNYNYILVSSFINNISESLYGHTSNGFTVSLI